MARKKKTRRVYRLPDYKTYTTSAKEYISAWMEIIEPLEKRLGLQLIGFDPDILMGLPANTSGYSNSVNIPLWLARRINAL